MFLSHKGQVHEILYSILTPVGYHVCVTTQGLRHIEEQHKIAAKYLADLPYLLNNPDFILPNWETRTTHLYYKVADETVLVVAVQQKDDTRFVATMHKTRTIKGLQEKMVSKADCLYIRGGYKWKRKWK